MAETILLVEDDPSLRRLSERLLAKFGYAVISAGDAASAEALCRSAADPVRLLMTDVFLPDGGGPDLAARLQQIQPDLKVLFVSGSSDAFDKGLLTRDANFLQKPFPADVLRKKIEDILAPGA